MTAPPTKAQITAALDRAANAAREKTPHGDRILKQQLTGYSAERRGDSWWLIGHLRVLGGAEEWDVLFNPETDQGRLRAKGS